VRKKRRPYIIFAINGGGIRGYFPAFWINYIEKSLNVPIAYVADMIAGTSTGGIIAHGLTVKDEKGIGPKWSAERALDFYMSGGYKIFEESRRRKLFTLFGFLDNEYRNEGLEESLDGYMGNSYLSESLTRVISTAYDTERRRLHIFDSKLAKKDHRFDCLARDAAIATAAAPAYFEPHLIKGDGSYQSLYDGGVGAVGNPAGIAMARALESGVRAEDIYLFSFGTGINQKPFLYDKVRKWGKAEAAAPAMQMLLDGADEHTDLIVKAVIPNYYRIQFNLSAELALMDKATSKHMNKMKAFAERYMKGNQTRFDNMVSLLDTLLENK
jgi:patatin-like phospholipase/acyl hydrolase